jgi:hypothetical protein
MRPPSGGRFVYDAACSWCGEAMVGSKSIYLIGPMGSGKTAVGKHLARLLGCPFVDSDHEIERTTGADIPLIFEREGEAGSLPAAVRC